MPLTQHQKNITLLLAANRTADSFLAGGAALNFSPHSNRYSRDLDYFHDSEKRLKQAFEADKEALISNGYQIEVDREGGTFISARVTKNGEMTTIDWAHDSAYRFMPALKDAECGYRLHPADLATNKLLAFVWRHYPRDYYDLLQIIDEVLPMGALIWAACGKDPGYNPLSLLETLKRKGKYRPEDFEDLMLTHPVDLQVMKMNYVAALEDAEAFIDSRPMNEHGCLYYSFDKKTFVQPKPGEANVVCHFGRPGGVLPQIVEV